MVRSKTFRHENHFFESINEVPDRQFIITRIDITIAYLQRNGIKIPKPLSIPVELLSYTKRKLTTINLNDFIVNSDKIDFPVFIKPNEILKGFTAGVLNKKSSIPFVFSDVENKEQEALISEVVSMESEYRCFIYKNKLVGIKHYQGDFELFPDINLIKEMIKKYTSSPIAYTLDVAVTDKNETILIECNDAWCIGNYGLDALIYIKMLRDRWLEILKENK